MTYKSPAIALFVLSVSLAGCVTPRQSRTVLMTFDGASDAYVDQLRDNSALNAQGFFAQSERKGFVAKELTPINVANTGPSHAAIFSGATPAVSGFVGQTFAAPADELPKGSDAFTYISDTETIVSAARRQGKRVACLTAPGLDGRTENYACDLSLDFLQSTQESLVIKFAPIAMSDQPRESPPQSGEGIRLIAKASRDTLPSVISRDEVQFRLVDRNPTDAIRFDTVEILLGDGVHKTIKPGQIFPFQRVEDGALVMNALWLNRFDQETGDVDLYWGQPFRTAANEAMMEAVIRRLGAWPGALDARGYHEGRISEAGYKAHNEFQAKYAIDAMAILLARNDWDLLIGYASYLDTVQHEYLVTSPHQVGFGTKAKPYAANIREAYLRLDQWMGRAVRQRNAERTNFIVASDHGMIATHTALAISSLIETWGYSVGGKSPDVGIFTSGASAHIYVNSDERPGGRLSQQKKREIVDDLIKRFRNLTDPSYKGIFAVVQPKGALSALDLQHPGNAGDIFVSATAGFSLDPRKSPTSRLLFPISFDRGSLYATGLLPSEIDFVASGFLNQSSYGVHGHVANTPGISAVFYALGPDVPRSKQSEVHALQITPSVACLLGILPPRSAHATPIAGFCKP